MSSVTGTGSILFLGKEVDNRGIGYNTNQSEIAIGSGSWFGKGWTEGTQTKGNFVPEQHTDYIFSTVGEEWGFVGSAVVVFLVRFSYAADHSHGRTTEIAVQPGLWL